MKVIAEKLSCICNERYIFMHPLSLSLRVEGALRWLSNLLCPAKGAGTNEDAI